MIWIGDTFINNKGDMIVVIDNVNKNMYKCETDRYEEQITTTDILTEDEIKNEWYPMGTYQE